MFYYTFDTIKNMTLNSGNTSDIQKAGTCPHYSLKQCYIILIVESDDKFNTQNMILI